MAIFGAIAAGVASRARARVDPDASSPITPRRTRPLPANLQVFPAAPLCAAKQQQEDRSSVALRAIYSAAKLQRRQEALIDTMGAQWRAVRRAFASGWFPRDAIDNLTRTCHTLRDTLRAAQPELAGNDAALPKRRSQYPAKYDLYTRTGWRATASWMTDVATFLAAHGRRPTPS